MEIRTYHNIDHRQECNIYPETLKIRLADFDVHVDNSYEDKDDMLLDLFKSILSVERKYVLLTEKKANAIQVHLEHVFAYELYRQWSNRIQITHPHLVINGEPEKSPKLFSKLFSKTHMYPDLVMHHDQSDEDFQGVVCEIKTSKVNSFNFKEDIEKLCCFVCGRKSKYRFDFGVFVLVGCGISRILEIMDEIDDHTFKAKVKSRTKRIICVAYDGESLQTVRFDWIISKKSRNQLRKDMERNGFVRSVEINKSGYENI